MTATDQFCGIVPQIVNNAERLYQGNLRHYLNILFHKAQNVCHAYHNWRHMTHVLVMAFFACLYHQKELTKLQIRKILIAALFHDFDHSGMSGPDALNIARALQALDTYLLPVDRPYQADIAWLIGTTEYPYKVSSDEMPLSALILRDADMSQVMNPAWIQQVVFGFASEWRMEPIEILRLQIPFLESVTFRTEWGRSQFPQSAIQEKIAEVKALLELLDPPVA